MKARIAGLALAGAVTLTGCGAAPVLSAAEQVPTLRTSLNSIDSALAHHRYASARRALTRLIAEARAAERSGSLSAAAADRIVSAARTLLAELPAASHPSSGPTSQAPSPSKSPSPSPSKTPSSTPAVTRPTHTTAPPAPTPTPTPTSSPTSSPTPTPSPSSTVSPAVGPTGA